MAVVGWDDQTLHWLHHQMAHAWHPLWSSTGVCYLQVSHRFLVLYICMILYFFTYLPIWAGEFWNHLPNHKINLPAAIWQIKKMCIRIWVLWTLFDSSNPQVCFIVWLYSYRNPEINIKSESYWKKAFSLQSLPIDEQDGAALSLPANQKPGNENVPLWQRGVPTAVPEFLQPVLPHVLLAGKSMEILEATGKLSRAGQEDWTGERTVRSAFFFTFPRFAWTLCSLSFLLTQLSLIYCICHIFRGGFIFTNFVIWVLFANLTTCKNIYLRSWRMNATCVRNAIVVQYTVHVQGRIANFPFWKWVNDKYWFLRPLLSSIANLTTRKNVLKSRFAKK